jgi:hypothetical protein
MVYIIIIRLLPQTETKFLSTRANRKSKEIENYYFRLNRFQNDFSLCFVYETVSLRIAVYKFLFELLHRLILKYVFKRRNVGIFSYEQKYCLNGLNPT